MTDWTMDAATTARLTAALDLLDAVGATHVSLGNDGQSAGSLGEDTWYALAHAGGPRRESGAATPIHAAEALARRVATGRPCWDCGRPITFTDEAPASCRFARTGDGPWLPGCNL